MIQDNRVLLVKRNKEPAKGQWAIPGGSVKLGETLRAAVEREIQEESGLIVKARDPVYTFDVIERDDKGQIRFHYVIIDFTADLVGGDLLASDDADDARWFSPEEIEGERVNETTKRFLRKMNFLR